MVRAVCGAVRKQDGNFVKDIVIHGESSVQSCEKARLEFGEGHSDPWLEQCVEL